ncbi:Winged helix-like DNA-binding domain superfamily [Sesbania bispinosa]|nr:Winged helix-like DNA-binding domain superfamily [Sesbania bispinosa]
MSWKGSVCPRGKPFDALSGADGVSGSPESAFGKAPTADLAEAAAPVAASPAKKASAKSSAASKKPRAKPAHPKTADMVASAISSLKERGGSSLQAIKKYIAANYKVDAEKLSPFIKKYLKGAVASGKLVQTKGKGASGSFKLASKDKADKPVKPKKAVSPEEGGRQARRREEGQPAKKPAAAAAAKKPAAQRSLPPQRRPAAEKKPKPAAAAAKKPKSPSQGQEETRPPREKAQDAQAQEGRGQAQWLPRRRSEESLSLHSVG